MFFRHKHALKAYLRFSSNFNSLRNIHISFPSHIRGLKRENYRTAYVLPEKKCDNKANTQESSESNNFYGIENDEGVIIVDDSKSVYIDQLPVPAPKGKKKEVCYSTSFGIVRRDSENKVKYHGEYDESILKSQLMHSVATHITNSITDTAVTGIRNRSVENKSKTSLGDPYKVDISIQNKNSVSSNNKSNVSEFQDQSEQQNKVPDVTLNPKHDLSVIDQLYFTDSAEKIVSSEMKNSNESKTKAEINYIDECYFPGPTDEIKYNTSVTSENLQSSNDIFREAEIPESQEENVSNIQQLKAHSVLQNKITNVPLNEESDVSFLDQLYFSNSPEKVLPVKGSASSNFKEFSNRGEYCFQNSKNLQNDSSVKNENLLTLCDSNINKKSEPAQNFPLSSKDNPGYPGNKGSVKSNLMDSVNESMSNITAKDMQNSISLNNKNLENISKTLVYNKMSLESENANQLNKSNTVNKIIANKKLDHLYESILKSSKKVDIDINSVFWDKKNANSNSIVENTSSIDPNDFSQPARELTNYNKNGDIRKMSLENNTNKVDTAHDFVLKLREEQKEAHHEIREGINMHSSMKRDSKGFRILSNQVPDFSSYTRDEILQVLIKSVVYADDDLLVLNKPYNLVIHDSKTTKEPCLSTFLDDIAKELDRENSNSKLFTVHRIDKETTGCLLLARNELAAQNLKSLFAQRKVLKTYWIVTARIPEPLEGIIDIPIAEGTVENRSRMVLRPNIPKDMNFKNHCKGGKRAVTRYKVISESGNAALVEVKPETGIKHQIRVHFGFGLSCPILGDHKYSHLTKLAPQKLPNDLLQRLQVRQSKVRHIPMHIHARTILIPEYHPDGRNLFVMAPLPAHMSKNLRSLKFKK